MALGVEDYPFLIDRENYLRLNLFFFVSKWEIGNRLGGDKVSIFDRVSEDSRKVVCTATVLLFLSPPSTTTWLDLPTKCQ